jgi:hypothetical protein
VSGLAVVQRKTPHPCAGMTPAQRRDFELIATGQRPRGGYQTINKLKARGLIEDAPPKVLGRDALGVIAIPQWTVPLSVHMQWCKWCNETEFAKNAKKSGGRSRGEPTEQRRKA